MDRSPFVRTAILVVILCFVVGVVAWETSGRHHLAPRSTPTSPASPTTRPRHPETTPPMPRQLVPTTPPVQSPKTLLGALDPQPEWTIDAYAAGLRAVVVEANWSLVEPAQGVVDDAYLGQLQLTIDRYEQEGMGVIFSPGLQYTPSWVFALSPSSRFVDQYGTAWHGQQGEDVADAVWNLAIRRAQQSYLQVLGAALQGTPLVSVRVGGLLDGELRLPWGGPHNSFWAFDAAAQAGSPVPGWKPGDPGTQSAAAFLQWYLSSLVGYERFILGAEQAAFPSSTMEVLFPNWGVRPGQTDMAVAGDLTGNSPAERDGNLQQGLDWADQVAALPSGTIVYSTDLGAPSVGLAADDEAPIFYLAQLARARGLPLGGENAGGGGPGVFLLCTQRADQLHLVQFLWFTEGDFFSGQANQPSLADVRQASALLGG